MPTIDPATKIILIPKSDLVLVSGTLWTLDTEAFRLAMHALLDDEDYIWMDDWASRNPPLTVGGVTLAQTIEVINSWMVEFDDTSGTDQYSVRLEGSNNNLFDIQGGILIQNLVQVIPTNSAGLIYSKQLEDNTFEDSRIWIDVAGGAAGTTFPIGTPANPVNNLADAKTIISTRGLAKRLHIRGTLTVGAAENLDDYDVVGLGNLLSEIIFTAGATSTDGHFRGFAVSGTMSGEGIFAHCAFGAISGFNGEAIGSGFGGVITLDAAATSVNFVNCHSDVSGTGTPEVDCNSAMGLSIAFRGYYGGMLFSNFNDAGNNCSFDADSIRLTIAASCTDGSIVVGGVGLITDNSGPGCTVTTESFISQDAIFTRVMENGETFEEQQRLQRAAAAGKIVQALDGSYAIRDAADTKDRITGDDAANGGRDISATDGA